MMSKLLTAVQDAFENGEKHQRAFRVQHPSQPHSRALRSAGSRRFLPILERILYVCILASGALPVALAEEGGGEDKKIQVSLDYSLFFPRSAATKTNFGKRWGGLSVGRFDGRSADRWHFDADLQVLTEDGRSKALLVPVTVGVKRGFGANLRQQPYVAARLGPYYGKVKRNTFGADDSKIGFNANVSAGIVFDEKYFVEARFNWFSGLAGNDFDGLSLAAGVKVFEFSP